jgi:hypothetical protein
MPANEDPANPATPAQAAAETALRDSFAQITTPAEADQAAAALTTAGLAMKEYEVQRLPSAIHGRKGGRNCQHWGGSH